MDGEIDLESVTRVAIETIVEAHEFTFTTLRTSPTWAFAKFDIPRQTQTRRRGKPALNIDIAVENVARTQLKTRLASLNPLVLGEEYGDEPLTPTLDLTGRDRLIILVDMVDGTDLLERNLWNWCSAMIFYYPKMRKAEDRILASFIGLPGEGVYFARRDRAKVLKATVRRSIENGESLLRIDTMVVAGPSSVETLAQASVSFYGQKIPNLFSVALKEDINASLVPHAFAKNMLDLQKTKPATRIYNLAGNPMMMRLIDDGGLGHTRIDAVFDLNGQLPHDAVPGLYIAHRAGAILRDVTGSVLTPELLAKKLMRPASEEASEKVRYVVSSSKRLCDELLDYFND